VLKAKTSLKLHFVVAGLSRGFLLDPREKRPKK